MHISELSVVVSCSNLFYTCMRGRRMQVLRNIGTNTAGAIGSPERTRTNRVLLTRCTRVKCDSGCLARYKSSAVFALLRLASVTQLCVFLFPLVRAARSNMLIYSEGTQAKAQTRQQEARKDTVKRRLQ